VVIRENKLGNLGKYFTWKLNGFFVFAADITYSPDKLDYIYVENNLGIGGRGSCYNINSYFTYKLLDWDYLWVYTSDDNQDH
jgi:hypothetical protein